MKNLSKSQTRIAVTLALLLGVTAVGQTQIKQAIKIIGIGAAVKQFGPDLNKAMNKLTNHKDSYQETTKVVPILAIGLGKSSAIGAAQVTGPKNKVDLVEAVASPEADFLGKEVRIRGMIPVSSKDVLKDIKKVEGVGVTGIIDLKL